MTRPARTTHADLARYHAIEAATWPPRITQAITQILLALDPRHQPADGPGPVNGISDPTGTAVANPNPDTRHAREDRRALTKAIERLDDNARTITTILNRWAPQHAGTSTATMWCTNHQRYGHNVPRSADGSKCCDWCMDVQRNYGTLPNHELIRLHAQGRRLNTTDYERTLNQKTG